MWISLLSNLTRNGTPSHVVGLLPFMSKKKKKNVLFTPTDLSQLQHLPRDSRTSPRQGAEQKVLEEVVLYLAEVRALCLQ